MTVEQGRYGLWYSKGVGFATQEQAQAHEDDSSVPGFPGNSAPVPKPIPKTAPAPAPVAAAAHKPAPAPEPAPKSLALWPGAVVGTAMAVGLMVLVTKCALREKVPDELGWNAALVMCQSALRNASRDPDRAEVPYVPNQGSGDEYSYTWGPGTSMTRVRNGLGMEVAAPAACTVSKAQRRITSLSLNGRAIL